MINRVTTRSLRRTVVPGEEAATLRARDRDDAGIALASYTDYTIYRAKFRPQDSSETVQDGVVLSALPEGDWEVWQEQLDYASAPRPREGDLWVRSSDGTTWRVKKVTVKMFDNVIWTRCVQELTGG